MRAPKAYTEALSQAYDERHFGGKSGQHILERDCRALWSLLDGTYSYVLDVPCGSGIYSQMMADRGHRVVAADASLPMLELVRRLGRAESTVHSDIEHLPFPDDSFDATVTLRMFSHCPKDAVVRGLRELGRVIRPGGRVIFDTFRWTPRRWPLARRVLDQNCIYVISPREVEKSIEDAGLLKIESRSLYIFSPLLQRRMPFMLVRGFTALEALLPPPWRLRTFWACTKESPATLGTSRVPPMGSP